MKAEQFGTKAVVVSGERNHYQELLEAVIHNSSDNFVLLDKDLRVVIFNTGFQQFSERFAGVTPKPGMALKEVTPLNRHEHNSTNLSKALAGESVKELAVVPVQNETAYFEVAYNPVYSGSEITHIAISAMNVTDRIQQEEKLRIFAENLSIIQDNTTDQYVLFDVNGLVTFFNKSFESHVQELFGVTPEVGMNYLELVPEYRKGPARDLFERVRKGETIRTLSEIRGPVGSFYFELYLKPIMKDGVVTHIFRSTSDVTLKWIQEKAIREYRQNLEIIFEESADYFLLLDASGKVVLFNHKCAELTLNALGRAIMTGDLIFEVLPAIAKAQASFVFEQALNDQTGSTEVPIETSKGRVWLHIRYTPVKEQEKVVNVCLVAIDITARKMQELELNDYRLSLERKVAERTAELNLALEKEHELLDLKNKFVSMVSHEFRTPLATIGLASDFVSRYIDRLGPQEITAKLQMVGRQVKHMSAMLEDVLTIGRYEANRIQTQYTVFNLRSLLQEISEEVQGSINPTVHVDFTFAGDFEVNSDPVLMRSIFVNLVGNAVKFSGSGTVVHLSVNHSEGQVTTVVKDQGLGIPADDLNKLFQPFFRAGNVVSVVGTGLGLSIVKKAVEKLGGTIEVASEVGKGSTFKVTLPST